MSTTEQESEGSAAHAAVLPLTTTVGHLIRRAQQMHTSLWTQEFERELTSPQYALLSALTIAATDQRSAGELASLDKSTAADVVARLERTGWLARERDPLDGRRYALSLTAPARTALRHITPRVSELQRRLLEPLSPDDRPWFVQALARVAYGGTPPQTRPGSARAEALPLASTPGHLIRRSEQLHALSWAKRVGSILTPPQYALLSAVTWHSPVDQGTAGELASLDKSSMTDIIARLTRRGLVGSRPDADDRRRKFVQLTPQARVVLEQVTPSVEEVQRDVLAPLDEREALRFVELLRTVAYR